jgi:bifunctional non-homologous end joining protein LigD
MPLPHVLPMVLARAMEPFDHPEFLFEMKYDGFRALAYIEDGQCQLISRKKHAYKAFDLLCQQIARTVNVSEAIVDGEIACLDGEGRPIFDQLMYRRGEPCFCAFDILWLNSQDLRGRPLIERKAILRQVIPITPPSSLLYVGHEDGRGIELFNAVCAYDLEGVVAKWKYGEYTGNDKTSSWLKIKNATYSQAVGRREQFDRFRRRLASVAGK